jgi:hypothetical protein
MRSIWRGALAIVRLEPLGDGGGGNQGYARSGLYAVDNGLDYGMIPTGVPDKQP